MVIDTPGFDQLLGISQVEEPVLVQAFVPKLAVETFDGPVLHWFPRCDDVQLDALPAAHWSSARLTNSGPLATRMRSGLPYSSISRSKTRMTRSLGSDLATSIA